MVLRHWEYRWRGARCWHTWFISHDSTNSELALRLSSAVELLVDSWIIAIKLDVVGSAVGVTLECNGLA